MFVIYHNLCSLKFIHMFVLTLTISFTLILEPTPVTWHPIMALLVLEYSWLSHGNRRLKLCQHTWHIRHIQYYKKVYIKYRLRKKIVHCKSLWFSWLGNILLVIYHTENILWFNLITSCSKDQSEMQLGIFRISHTYAHSHQLPCLVGKGLLLWNHVRTGCSNAQLSFNT